MLKSIEVYGGSGESALDDIKNDAHFAVMALTGLSKFELNFEYCKKKT